MEFDQLPGFQFHPTEEELLDFYLKRTVFGKQSQFGTIGFLNIYLHEPWDLPGLAKIGEREWYFLVHREGKNGHRGRPNRTTANGYWKTTGSDRPIRCLTDPKRLLGHKKTLVFYKGRAPRGCKTDWVMNEYRLPSNLSLPTEILLCKVYRKAISLKVLEHRAATGQIAWAPHSTSSSPLVTQETFPFYDQENDINKLFLQDNIFHKEEGGEVAEGERGEQKCYFIPDCRSWDF